MEQEIGAHPDISTARFAGARRAISVDKAENSRTGHRSEPVAPVCARYHAAPATHEILVVLEDSKLAVAIADVEK